MNWGDTRQKDVNWNIRVNDNGRVDRDLCQLAVLMDLRDELKALNAKLACTGQLHETLKRIDTNTRKKKKKPLRR